MKIKIEEEIIFDHKSEKLGLSLGVTPKQGINLDKIIAKRFPEAPSLSEGIEYCLGLDISFAEKILIMFMLNGRCPD